MVFAPIDFGFSEHPAFSMAAVGTWTAGEHCDGASFPLHSSLLALEAELASLGGRVSASDVPPSSSCVPALTCFMSVSDVDDGTRASKDSHGGAPECADAFNELTMDASSSPSQLKLRVQSDRGRSRLFETTVSGVKSSHKVDCFHAALNLLCNGDNDVTEAEGSLHLWDSGYDATVLLPSYSPSCPVPTQPALPLSANASLLVLTGSTPHPLVASTSGFIELALQNAQAAGHWVSVTVAVVAKHIERVTRKSQLRAVSWHAVDLISLVQGADALVPPGVYRGESCTRHGDSFDSQGLGALLHVEASSPSRTTACISQCVACFDALPLHIHDPKDEVAHKQASSVSSASLVVTLHRRTSASTPSVSKLTLIVTDIPLTHMPHIPSHALVQHGTCQLPKAAPLLCLGSSAVALALRPQASAIPEPWLADCPLASVMRYLLTSGTHLTVLVMHACHRAAHTTVGGDSGDINATVRPQDGSVLLEQLRLLAAASGLTCRIPHCTKRRGVATPVCTSTTVVFRAALQMHTDLTYTPAPVETESVTDCANTMMATCSVVRQRKAETKSAPTPDIHSRSPASRKARSQHEHGEHDHHAHTRQPSQSHLSPLPSESIFSQETELGSYSEGSESDGGFIGFSDQLTSQPPALPVGVMSTHTGAARGDVSRPHTAASSVPAQRVRSPLHVAAAHSTVVAASDGEVGKPSVPRPTTAFTQALHFASLLDSRPPKETVPAASDKVTSSTVLYPRVSVADTCPMRHRYLQPRVLATSPKPRGTDPIPESGTAIGTSTGTRALQRRTGTSTSTLDSPLCASGGVSSSRPSLRLGASPTSDSRGDGVLHQADVMAKGAAIPLHTRPASSATQVSFGESGKSSTVMTVSSVPVGISAEYPRTIRVPTGVCGGPNVGCVDSCELLPASPLCHESTGTCISPTTPLQCADTPNAPGSATSTSSDTTPRTSQPLHHHQFPNQQQVRSTISGWCHSHASSLSQAAPMLSHPLETSEMHSSLSTPDTTAATPYGRLATGMNGVIRGGSAVANDSLVLSPDLSFVGRNMGRTSFATPHPGSTRKAGREPSTALLDLYAVGTAIEARDKQCSDAEEQLIRELAFLDNMASRSTSFAASRPILESIAPGVAALLLAAPLPPPHSISNSNTARVVLAVDAPSAQLVSEPNVSESHTTLSVHDVVHTASHATSSAGSDRSSVTPSIRDRFVTTGRRESVSPPPTVTSATTSTTPETSTSGSSSSVGSDMNHSDSRDVSSYSRVVVPTSALGESGQMERTYMSSTDATRTTCSTNTSVIESDTSSVRRQLGALGPDMLASTIQHARRYAESMRSTYSLDDSSSRSQAEWHVPRR